jgi:glycosyltransferase involved in cell wall biosynthesis
MARPLSVLQVTPRFLPQVGGIETHVFEVAGRLARLGLHVEILTTDATGDLTPRDRIGGVPVSRVRAWPRGWDYHFAPGIVPRIRSGEWDVVHVQGIHTLVPPLAMMAARSAGIPYVVTFHTGGHSSSVRSRMRPIQWLAMRPLLRGASRLIGVSRFERDIFRRGLALGSHRFAVIRNGTEIATEVSPISLGPVDPNLIVSVGRLERYKGHWRLVEALPALRAKRPNARLRIVGDGPDRDRLLRRAYELDVGAHVEIQPIPIEDRATLVQLLSRASVFALLSEYEAHAIAVMEAVGLGRPVVVADATGLREVAQMGWARPIPLTSTPEHIAAVLLEEMNRRGQPPADVPTWDHAASALASIYHEVTARGS